MSVKDFLCCNENIFGVEVNEDGVFSVVLYLCVFYYNYNGCYEDVNKL